jgi:hypothetical protein
MARVSAQLDQERVHLVVVQPTIALLEGALQPLECAVLVPAGDAQDADGELMAKRRAFRCQRGFCFVARR